MKSQAHQHINGNWQIIAIAVLVAALAGTTVWAARERSQSNQLRRGSSVSGRATVDTQAALEEHGITPLTSDQASNNSQTASKLAFLIEEEKLAHDVYQIMYAKWGARTFGNIMDSEAMHQNMVLAVMKSRGLTDPRQSTVGRFTNPELQKLYDQLIAQGNQSVGEAYKVGVAIEEKDIADIKTIVDQLDPRDTDVKDVLDNLSQGSENHLRAFNRQLSR